eukprot:3311833-Prymnesium_polylepis.1
MAVLCCVLQYCADLAAAPPSPPLPSPPSLPPAHRLHPPPASPAAAREKASLHAHGTVKHRRDRGNSTALLHSSSPPRHRGRNATT